MTPHNTAATRVPMPPRIASLPVTDKGWPVPWFAAWFNGTPDLRVVDTPKVAVAVRQRRCFVCGQPLGRFLTATVGPMCAVTRTVSEPPAHRDCATYAAQVCPFLANPRTKRHTADKPDGVVDAPGLPIDRNPGCVAVWTTTTVKPFRAPDGGALFTIGEPTIVEWFAEGRTATRSEVQASIDSGLPILLKAAEADGPDAVRELTDMVEAACTYMPVA